MKKVEVFQNTDLLFNAAAALIIELYEKAIAERGNFKIALSGGNTPKKLFELLATPAFSKKINWKQVFVFWSDERNVPISDEENNSHMASIALLNNVAIPKENIFPVPVNFKPAEAAAMYEQMIIDLFKTKQPRFDLVMLGIGDDGHTASLFPGTDILEEKKALVKDVFVEEKNTYRISFTLPLINNAINILFLVVGKDKAPVIKKVFAKPLKQLLPAELIKPIKGKIHWYLDEPAAALIKK